MVFNGFSDSLAFSGPRLDDDMSTGVFGEFPCPICGAAVDDEDVGESLISVI